jgi:hypothetical protein
MVHCQSEKWCECIGLQKTLGLGSYETAWGMLHRLRRAMANPKRERLCGVVEVDETYVGGRDQDKGRAPNPVCFTPSQIAKNPYYGFLRLATNQECSCIPIHCAFTVKRHRGPCTRVLPENKKPNS